MGMSIDEAIKTVSLYDGYYALDLASAMKLKEATNVLRDAAGKYQKIKEELWADFNKGEYDYALFLRSLRLIIEGEEDKK